MKKILLFAAVAGLTLVSASPPDDILAEEDVAKAGYPACSRTVTDRCIQMYERGVASRGNLARNDDLGTDPPGVGLSGHAMPAPAKRYAASGSYPPCSSTVTDRCTQTYERGSHGGTRMARATRKHHASERRMQLALRAGERG